MLLNTHTDTNMQLTINSFGHFSLTRFFPDTSLTFSKIADISLTAVKIPDISRQVVTLEFVYHMGFQVVHKSMTLIEFKQSKTMQQLMLLGLTYTIFCGSVVKCARQCSKL